MTDMEIKEKIELMDLQGYTVCEIAEELGEFDCVQSFRECPSWCHEDADCHDCWCGCIKEELTKSEIKIM